MEDLDILIVQYLNGELKGRELQEFERRLREDPALQQELQLQQELEGTLQRHFRNQKKEEALLRNIKTFSSKVFQEDKAKGPEPGSRPAGPDKKPSPRLRSILIAVLATAAMILLILWAPWQSSLYDQYAIHPIAAFTQMSSTADNLSLAEQAFNSKDFVTATGLLEAYWQGHPDNVEIQYFLGISLLETGQYAEAERLFQELLQGHSVYKYEGAWYLALANLKQQLPARAREYLEQIPEGSDRYAEARELLDKLS